MHDSRQEQGEDRQADADQEDEGGEAGCRQAQAAQPAQPVHRSLGADGDEPAGLADQVGVDEQRHDAEDHDRGGENAGNAGLARAEIAVERGGEHVELHRQAQHIGNAELAEAFGEDQHDRRDQRRFHQRQHDRPGDPAAAGAQHARAILELTVEAAERAAEQQDDEGGVVQRQDDGDRYLPISQPVRRRETHRLDPALLAADRAVLEQRGPGQREGPGRQHVGHDQRGGEPAPCEHVGAADQPGEDTADDHRYDDRAEGDAERVPQRLPEHVAGDRGEEGSMQVIGRPLADGGPGATRIAELRLYGIEQDRDDRNDNQIGEQGRHQQADHRGRLPHRDPGAVFQSCGPARTGRPAYGLCGIGHRAGLACASVRGERFCFICFLPSMTDVAGHLSVLIRCTPLHP